jgi:hypothetical protein
MIAHIPEIITKATLAYFCCNSVAAPGDAFARLPRSTRILGD